MYMILIFKNNQNLIVFKGNVLFNILNQTEKLINSYIEHSMN